MPLNDAVLVVSNTHLLFSACIVPYSDTVLEAWQRRSALLYVHRAASRSFSQTLSPVGHTRQVSPLPIAHVDAVATATQLGLLELVYPMQALA